MLAAVTTGFSTFMEMAGTFVSSLTSTDGELYALLPVIGIGIAVYFGICIATMVKSLVKGF